jgi:molybdopterin synthase sulfur carrier subunit
MDWRLFATLAEAAGSDTVSVTVGPDATVGDALGALLEAAPAVEDRIYDDDGTLYDHVRLLKNGESVFAAGDGLAEPVTADDELALMPAVSGG